MLLVVISPESFDPKEKLVVREMLKGGLARYHVRKPQWNETEVVQWAEGFSTDERSHFVLHGSAVLARRLGFGGVHERDAKESAVIPQNDNALPRLWRSRSCHSPQQVQASFGVYDSVFLSPVFPSISKAGYGPSKSWNDRDLQELLSRRSAADHRTRVIALGGIQKSTTSQCRELGFDGVAALGAIWETADPVSAFIELRDACSAFAGLPLLARA